MRTALLPLALLIAAALPLQLRAQTTHMISTVGNTFAPALVNAVVGDEIHLMIDAPHTFTEVDQATWNADGTTSNGGYDFPAGEHSFALTEAGTIYYVCQPHASMGMKGRIVVTDATGVGEHTAATAMMLSPNPADSRVRLVGNALDGPVNVQLLDTKGVLVYSGVAAADGSLDISTVPVGNYVCMAYDRGGEALARGRLTIQR